VNLKERRITAADAQRNTGTHEKPAVEGSQKDENRPLRLVSSTASPENAPTPEYKLSDYGNAQRLVASHGDDIRSVPGVGWLVWDGSRWGRDQDGELERRAKSVARSIWDDTSNGFRGNLKDLIDWAKRSESAAGIGAMIKLARTEAPVVLQAAELDADPWLFNARNGTIDLRTGDLRPHHRGDMLTKRSDVFYCPDAQADVWDQFLLRITEGDLELVAFLQRAAGYSLTGNTGEEKLFFAHGPAATGKSTFLDALRGVFGEYAQTADFESFIKKSGDGGIRNDIARLAGARLVIGSEVDEGKQLAEGLIKQITGGDTVTARFLYKEAFEFKPQFKLWLAANARPAVNPNDSGMWRRIIQIPFTADIPESERDPMLKLRLRDDSQVQAAILAWAVTGCRLWQEHDLDPPERVAKYTEEYRVETDPLAEFLDEHCVFEPDAVDTRREIRIAYQEWARMNGHEAVHDRVLGASLRRRGVEEISEKVRGERGWKGVKLVSPTSQPPAMTDPDVTF
jgi:putative DNA primase/helicase